MYRNQPGLEKDDVLGCLKSYSWKAKSEDDGKTWV